MRNIAVIALVLGIHFSIMGSPLSRTIGKVNALSAQVIIENTDTSQNAYDSICPRYWFIKFNKKYRILGAGYDYRVTIHRKGSQPGTITILSPFNGGYYNNGDTLACDSFVFVPNSRVDTVKTDTTVIYWNYPRPTKRLAGSPLQLFSFTNHLKILLKSPSTSIAYTTRTVSQAARHNLPNRLRSKRKYTRNLMGMVNTHCQ
jgi:hypothetical protein